MPERRGNVWSQKSTSDFRELKRLKKNRPGAKVAIKNAAKELRVTLRVWETAYAKRLFTGV